MEREYLCIWQETPSHTTLYCAQTNLQQHPKTHQAVAELKQNRKLKCSMISLHSLELLRIRPQLQELVKKITECKDNIYAKAYNQMQSKE